MTLRAVEDGQFSGPHGRTRVYWDSQWEEYRVKLWQGGKRAEGADYHTDDKQDALDTAKVMTDEPRYKEKILGKT